MNISDITKSFYQEQIDTLNFQFHYLYKKFSEDCDNSNNLWDICLKYEKSPMIFSKNGKLHYLLGYRLATTDQYFFYSDNHFHYINNLNNYSNNEIIYSPNNLNIGSYIHMVKKHLLKI